MKVVCVMIICLAIAGCNQKVPGSKAAMGLQPKSILVDSVTVHVYATFFNKEVLVASIDNPTQKPLAYSSALALTGNTEIRLDEPSAIRLETKMKMHQVFADGSQDDNAIRRIYPDYGGQRVGDHVVDLQNGTTRH